MGVFSNERRNNTLAIGGDAKIDNDLFMPSTRYEPHVDISSFYRHEGVNMFMLSTRYALYVDISSFYRHEGVNMFMLSTLLEGFKS